MSWIEGFNKLHLELKAIIVTNILIAPIWIVDIYFFHNIFFTHAPLYLTLIFAYCLTTISAILNVFSCELLWRFIYKIALPKADTLYVLTGLFTFTLLSVSTVIGIFTIKNYYPHFDIYVFATWIFSIEIFLFVTLRIVQAFRGVKQLDAQDTSHPNKK